VHLYRLLKAYTDANYVNASITIGLAEDGNVKVFTGDLEETS
jgi:hypothetical protein